MALFTNIETELKLYAPAASLGLNMLSIAPSRDYIERNYIKKELGKEQYDALAAAYDDSIASPSPTAMSASEQALWQAVMAALGPLTLWHYAAANVAEINDKGQAERNAEDAAPARLWVSNLQRDTLYDQGMKELDNLLAFLDENKADYPDWVSGTGYAGLKSNLVQTTENFDEHVSIGCSRKLFKMLRPNIKKVEYITIRKALGEDFYNRLIEGLQNDDLTAGETIVLNKLIPAVAHMAIADTTLPVQLGRDGVFYLNSNTGNDTKNQTAPDESVWANMKREHAAAGKQYLNEALDYLNKNATAQVYPEYFNSDQYEDPSRADYGNINHENGSRTTIFSL